MKIHLKVSVKIRGGRICIPGVYDLDKDASLAETLEGVENPSIFESLELPLPVVEEGEPETEDDEDDDSEEEVEEEEEEAEEEAPSAPKKKGGRPKKKGK